MYENKKPMKTAQQIAEEAARKVLSDNDLLHEFVGDSVGIDTLAWDLVDASGSLVAEHALVELVQAAIEADRAQREA